MNELHKELRLGNAVKMKGGTTIFIIDEIGKEFVKISNISDSKNWANLDYGSIEGIPLTKENIEKYIDWEFEKGFNKSTKTDLFYHRTEYLLENIIDGSSSFEIMYSEHLVDPSLFQITYYINDKLLEFGLDDTLHNLQNLFYISCGQELPINKY